jgi:hypothetical protein
MSVLVELAELIQCITFVLIVGAGLNFPDLIEQFQCVVIAINLVVALAQKC